MIFKIEKAQCKLTNGTIATLTPDSSELLEDNICEDLELFRTQLKSQLDTHLDIIGVEVENIFFIYREYEKAK